MLRLCKDGDGRVLKNVIKKILTAIPIILGVITLIFFLVRLSGVSPVYLIAGEDPTLETIQALNEQWGFDKPIYVQWWRFISNLILRGDLGRGIVTSRAIMPDLVLNFKYTLQLMFSSMFVSILLGVPFGIITAMKKNTWIDHLVRFISLCGASMPGFWVAIMFLKIFAVDLKLFPVMGTGTGEGLWSVLWHLCLPSITLGLSLMAMVTRMTRTSMLEVMGEQYMTTAKAKGLTYNKQIMKHAFKNATIPIITVVGLQLGRLISMGMIVENIFFRPGIGQYLFIAITNMDFNMIQGTVLFVSVCLVVINIIVDIIYAIVDPRISY